MTGILRLSVGIGLCIALCSWQNPSFAKQTAKSTVKTSKTSTVVKTPKSRSSMPSTFNSSAAGSYLDRLREKMDKHWYLADGTNHVVIKATVAANGIVDKVELSS